MKTVILTIGLLVVSSYAVAEGQGDKRMRREQIKQELDLSDEQVKKMRAIRAEGGTRADMDAVLTEQQRSRANAMREEHGQRRAERMGNMKEHLHLSEGQIAEMEEIRKQGGSREELRAVLTDEQRIELNAWRDKHKGRAHEPQRLKNDAKPDQSATN